MAYDEGLAQRVRAALKRRKGLSERKMFGGVCFMLNGNMCSGVLNNDLILRMTPEQAEGALKRRHTRKFDLTGRAMKGFVVVQAPGIRTDEALRTWLKPATDFAAKLPAK